MLDTCLKWACDNGLSPDWGYRAAEMNGSYHFNAKTCRLTQRYTEHVWTLKRTAEQTLFTDVLHSIASSPVSFMVKTSLHHHSYLFLKNRSWVFAMHTETSLIAYSLILSALHESCESRHVCDASHQKCGQSEIVACRWKKSEKLARFQNGLGQSWLFDMFGMPSFCRVVPWRKWSLQWGLGPFGSIWDVRFLVQRLGVDLSQKDKGSCNHM